MRLLVGYELARYMVAKKLLPRTPPRFLQRYFACLPFSADIHLPGAHRTTRVIREQRYNMSIARQNFSEECEAAINRQINLELYASYVYMSMAYHFDRDDIALHGFHKFFKKMSDEEREHAEKLMKYQNMRGGRILLQDVKKPEVDQWGTGLEAMTSALKLEKSVNQSLLDLHKIVESKNDVQLGDFIEGEYLKEQVESIKQIANYVTQLTKVGTGFGEYVFDKETLQEKDD